MVLRGCTQLPSRGSGHSASLTLWSPELHPHSGGQLGPEGLCEALPGSQGHSDVTLTVQAVPEQQRETSGRAEETTAFPTPLTWTPRPVLGVGSSEQSGFD